MELRPIRTRRDHVAALKEVERLWNAAEGSREAEILEVLLLLVQAYEAKHYPIPDPDPIDFLNHVMEARGISRRDLEAFIGSRARVAEILNRVRPLSLEMIRRLSEGLGIPSAILIRRYETGRAAA
jgi:HTH-type transcriptional regulator / antitoxin HigA